MSTAGLPEEIVSCTAPSLLPQFLFISSLQPDSGSRTMVITSRNSPASTNFLLCFFTKNSFYVFYFHPAHCQDELRKPIETKKDQRKIPAKGFAASLHAPHECTVFERISSIKYSEFWVLSGIVSEGIYLSRVFPSFSQENSLSIPKECDVSRDFPRKTHLFLLLNTFFLPRTILLRFDVVHQPNKRTTSNFE